MNTSSEATARPPGRGTPKSARGGFLAHRDLALLDEQRPGLKELAARPARADLDEWLGLGRVKKPPTSASWIPRAAHRA